MNNQCQYCIKTGKLRVSKDESPLLEEDVYVCDYCWALLKNPATAMPLIRGHLSLTQGREMPEKQFSKILEQFMETISKFKPTS
jgi:hypothetical protein